MPIIPNINNQSVAILSDIEQWKEDIADAINTRGGVADASESFQELAEDITQIPSTGIFSDGVGLDNTFSFLKYVTSDINNEIVSINNSTITEITRDAAFIKNIALREVIMNGVTTISGGSAFHSCSSLQSVNLPNLTTISGSDTFHSCSSLQSVNLPNLTTISGGYTFYNCSSLQSVNLPNLTTISGGFTFHTCSFLQSVNLPNLTTMSGGSTFISCSSLQSVNLPNLTTISGRSTFHSCNSLNSVIFGTLLSIAEPFNNAKINLGNITIGQDTDINLPFNLWTATKLILMEGQSGIDELNSNLYNNLLTKLYDHSNDGETRILQIGWLDYITPENIAYANAKGWTITN